MSAQHQQFLDLAERLIDRHGRPIVLLEPEIPVASYKPSRDEKKIGVMGVQIEFDMTEVRGDLVRGDDKLFLIDGHAKVKPTMRILDYEKEAHAQIPMGEFTGNPFGLKEEQWLIADYSIVQIEETKPGQTITHYSVYARL